MNDKSAEITAERPCSCELSVNAKGDVSYKVKAYENTLVAAIENAFYGKNIVERKLKEKASPPKGEPASQ